MFEDLLEANRRYRDEFHDAGVDGRAGRGLAVVTCIDSRIDPLAMLGLRAGDAKVLRNAGARVTEDTLRSLVLAVALLGVTRVCVVQHTDCAVVGTDEEALRAHVAEASGADTSGWDFLAGADAQGLLEADLERIRSCPLLPAGIAVAGFVFDVHSGALRPAG